MAILLLVYLAAFTAAALNAVAGGETFLAFPVLTGLAGLTEKAANVACTIGLWPGSASAVAAVRKEFKLLPMATNLTAAMVFMFGPVQWHFVAPVAICSTAGGYVGMHAAQRLLEKRLRRVILSIAMLLTAAYFWKVYL